MQLSISTTLRAAVSLDWNKVKCRDKPHILPPSYPFWFKGHTHGFDTASVRRGYEVYRNVCATCHSMTGINYRIFSNTVLPSKRMKDIAREHTYLAEPNDQGVIEERPGTLLDNFKSPYSNSEEARYANGGALPMDLAWATTANHDGADHVFSILTGYTEPPAGIEVPEGKYYNPYFEGALIGMPPPLEDNMMEYEDGTPATVSQMAKDVTEFLAFAADPHHDERKLQVLKVFSGLLVAAALCYHGSKFLFTSIRSRRLDFVKAKIR